LRSAHWSLLVVAAGRRASARYKASAILGASAARGSQQEFLLVRSATGWFFNHSSSLTDTNGRRAYGDADKSCGSGADHYSNYNILIEGFTPTSAARASTKNNRASGARRASVVVNYLFQRRAFRLRAHSKSYRQGTAVGDLRRTNILVAGHKKNAALLTALQ